MSVIQWLGVSSDILSAYQTLSANAWSLGVVSDHIKLIYPMLNEHCSQWASPCCRILEWQYLHCHQVLKSLFQDPSGKYMSRSLVSNKFLVRCVESLYTGIMPVSEDIRKMCSYAVGSSTIPISSTVQWPVVISDWCGNRLLLTSKLNGCALFSASLEAATSTYSSGKERLEIKITFNTRTVRHWAYLSAFQHSLFGSFHNNPDISQTDGVHSTELTKESLMRLFWVAALRTWSGFKVWDPCTFISNMMVEARTVISSGVNPSNSNSAKKSLRRQHGLGPHSGYLAVGWMPKACQGQVLEVHMLLTPYKAIPWDRVMSVQPRHSD